MQADAAEADSAPSAPVDDPAMLQGDSDGTAVRSDESAPEEHMHATSAQSLEASDLTQIRQLSGTLSTASSGAPLLLGHADESSDAPAGSKSDGGDASFRPGTPQLPSSSEVRARRLPALRGPRGATPLSRQACADAAAYDSDEQVCSGPANGAEDRGAGGCSSKEGSEPALVVTGDYGSQWEENSDAAAWGFVRDAAVSPDAERMSGLSGMDSGIGKSAGAGASSSEGAGGLVQGSNAVVADQVMEEFNHCESLPTDDTQKVAEKSSGVLVVNIMASSCMHATVVPAAGA